MQLDNIKSIRDSLHRRASDNNFYDNSEEDFERYANNFVDSFCAENGLTAHTVSPFRWNFESEKFGMIDDGVVELHKTSDSDPAIFEYVDVSKAKLTDENNIMN